MGFATRLHLKHRGLSGVVPSVLRFHPRLAYHNRGRTLFPAIVARITRVDGMLVGLHRTYLDPDGAGKRP